MRTVGIFKLTLARRSSSVRIEPAFGESRDCAAQRCGAVSEPARFRGVTSRYSSTRKARGWSRIGSRRLRGPMAQLRGGIRPQVQSSSIPVSRKAHRRLWVLSRGTPLRLVAIDSFRSK